MEQFDRCSIPLTKICHKKLDKMCYKNNPLQDQLESIDGKSFREEQDHLEDVSREGVPTLLGWDVFRWVLSSQDPEEMDSSRVDKGGRCIMDDICQLKCFSSKSLSGLKGFDNP